MQGNKIYKIKNFQTVYTLQTVWLQQILFLKYGNALFSLTDLNLCQTFSDGLYSIQEREYHGATPKITLINNWPV